MALPPIEFIDLKAQQRLIRARVDAAIARVLDHGQYIMGPEIFELERQLSHWTGAKHSLSCASGTDALLIAMMAKGLGPGDAVLCPAFTYTATPETIALLGASPVFVDVDGESFNLAPQQLKAGLDAAQNAGLTPRAIIAVDLFGRPADYVAIADFAKEHGLWVLADAAQSFGASSSRQRVGTFGQITATSFFPAKPLGCYGDGGAIFTDDDTLAEVMKSIRLHGKGDDKYDIVRIGVNGRLDTLQAAILIEKLAIFADEIVARQRVALRYSQALTSQGKASSPVRLPLADNATASVWAQYTIQVPAEKRTAIAAAMKADGVPTQIYYPRPVPAQTAYDHYPVAQGGTVQSQRLSREVLSLPMHPYLDEASQDRIIASLLRAVEQ
jgi:dTDP-4-amino-4,6-dideoxygalactose transaminase